MLSLEFISARVIAREGGREGGGRGSKYVGGELSKI